MTTMNVAAVLFDIGGTLAEPQFSADRSRLIGLKVHSVVGLHKPHPEIYQLAALRAGLAGFPERCLYVGEAETDRQGAVQAG